MMPIEHAYEIALSEIYLPEDSALTYSKYLSNRYVFEWRHQYENIYSETDRILIWVDPLTGNITKKVVEWTDLKYPISSQLQIQSVSGIKIIGYHKISKLVYFTYTDEPLSEWYWIGEDTCTRYLINEYGNVVGEMIPKPNGCSYSGHTSLEDNTGCWSTSFYADYFNRWTDGSIDQKCGTGITSTIYSNMISDPSTDLYACTAHGAYNGFSIHSNFYVSPSYVTNIMKNRLPIKFAELIHCEAMNYTGSGTLSYAYRKGSTNNTITIGLKHTTNDSWGEYLRCFRRSFHDECTLNKDTSIKQIYDDTMALCPNLDGHFDFVGDISLCINDIIIKPLCAFTIQ